MIAVLIAVGFGSAIFTGRQDPASVSYLITGNSSTPVRVDDCESYLTKASKAEVYDEFRKADAIGDNESAQKWADYIRSKVMSSN